MTRKVLSSPRLDAKGTDDLWKDIYDVCTDTIQTSQHELLIGSWELSQHDQKIITTVPNIPLNNF